MAIRPRPTLGRATALRPATYAGIAAAVVSIGAAVLIRQVPSMEGVVGMGHLVATSLLYATGGALAARLGAAGWRAGLFAGLIDALVGHAIAFFIAPPPDPSTIAAPVGRVVTPELAASIHLWGAVTGAVMAVIIGAAAGWAGARYVQQMGKVRGP